jgi:hypothetical protein
MSSKLLKHAAIIFFLPLCSLCAGRVSAQESFEHSMGKSLDSLLNGSNSNTSIQTSTLGPDDAMQGIMAPTGWGGSGTFVFGGLSGTYPEEYVQKNRPDLIANAGFCVGDAEKAVNFAAGINMTDVHRLQDFSANFILSRELSPDNSISAGALQAFASSTQSDSPAPTYFIAFSHAVQWLPSQTPGCAALSYSIGIGNGRFLDKSPEDVLHGKGKYATAVFGSVSYEVIQHVNLNAEWYAQNLGFSIGARPFKNPLSFGFGVDNLTSYSGDKTSMVFTVGYPLSLMRAPN